MLLCFFVVIFILGYNFPILKSILPRIYLIVSTIIDAKKLYSDLRTVHWVEDILLYFSVRCLIFFPVKIFFC